MSSASRSAKTPARAAKKASWAARKRVQSASSTERVRAPGGLPPVEQVAHLGGRGAPVGGGGERLGLGDQGLLGLLRGGPLLGQCGEVRAPAPVEGVAGRAEALPQRLLGGPVDPRRGLPLVEQLLEPLARGLPLLAVGERLGLGDQRLAGGERLGLGRGLLGGRGAAQLADRAAAASTFASNAGDVTDVLVLLTPSRILAATPGPRRPARARAWSRDVSRSTSSASASYLRT